MIEGLLMVAEKGKWIAMEGLGMAVWKRKGFVTVPAVGGDRMVEPRFLKSSLKTIEAVP
jgi:hypothetical protein